MNIILSQTVVFTVYPGLQDALAHKTHPDFSLEILEKIMMNVF
jgi:hypothetical protein